MSQIKSINSRFLYSFFYDDKKFEQVVDELLKLKIGERYVWEKQSAIKELYQQEMLSSVDNFIFGKIVEKQYFCLNHELANSWFGAGLEVKKHNEEPLFTGLVKLSPHQQIELFLLPHGIGILSIPLSAELNDIATLKTFNYQLSQGMAKKAPYLSKPYKQHPNNPNPMPDLNSELSQRLGKGGGKWTLIELREKLLENINIYPETKKTQFSVYSVLHFDQVDFSSPEQQKTYLPLLTSLAHVEELDHAGNLEVVQQLLNTRHWCAAGTLGAVHFVSDQGIAFDQQRVPIVFNKYFIAYLLVSMQRLFLLRILDKARNSLDKQEDILQQLHESMLKFTLSGYVSEISIREVLNQYYRLVRKALRVENSFKILQRALHDADEREIAKVNKNNQHQMLSMQSKIEWLEVFFASYYAGALAYYISYGWFSKEFSSLSSLVWATTIGLVALFGLRPWAHDKITYSSWFIFLGIPIVTFIAWLILGFWVYPKI